MRDPVYLKHRTGEFHPESHLRLEALYELLDEPEMLGLYNPLEPRKATRKEIEYIHSPDYYDTVEATSSRDVTYLDPDTATSRHSFEAALYAAGGVLAGIDILLSDSKERVFALVRPPGHHAEKERGMGFCIFNNVAVGAAYAIERYSIRRVLIVDWDLHHGNGTQRSFYTDPRVLYFSTHQYPYYPGSGAAEETGHGEGEGYTVNVPLAPGMGDEEYCAIFERILLPIAQMYKPQLLLVSAGFDAYHDDPLGGMRLTSSGFKRLTEVLKSIAESHADGKLLLALEGGYDLNGLRDCVKSVIESLTDVKAASTSRSGKQAAFRGQHERYIENVLSVQRRYWSCF